MSFWRRLINFITKEQEFIEYGGGLIKNNCSYPGCRNKLDWPPLKGRDGNYYCKYHILPENRGEISTNRPSADYRVIHSGGRDRIKTK